MATKNASSLGFWIAVIGCGFIIVLLGSFSLYQSRGPMMRSTQTAGGSGGAIGMAPGRPVSSPEADMFYSGGKMMDAGVAISMPSPMPPVYVGGGDTAATATPRIIKTGSLTLEVKSSREGAVKVSDVAKAQGGFVETSNIVENEDGTVSAYATIRVPEKTFEATMAQLRGMALRVASESVNGRDVTEQYTDLQARLKNAQAQEAQYLDILKKANTVQDILAVQQYLSQVRYEIESLQGQIKFLGNQTTYSTISITLTEQANLNLPAGKFDLLRDMKQAGQAVILLGQALLTFAVWFVIIGGAIFIPGLLILFLIYKLIRKLLNR